MALRIGKLSYDPSDPNKIIGRGSFGTVFNGSYHYLYYLGATSGVGKSVAIKRILKNCLLHKNDEVIIKNELELLRKASHQHPNILRYIGEEETDRNFL